MDYKYNKRQIFGKRLKVPRHILKKVYNRTLSIDEFFEYKLDDKIPITCIYDTDRKIVEKFGIDKCKELDWQLINSTKYYSDIRIRNILMSIDAQTEDINRALYEIVKDQIRPIDYSPKMAELFPDRIIDASDIENPDLKRIIEEFNLGRLDLKTIIEYWDFLKNKDLSFCLLHDEKNTNHITNDMLKEFMSNCGKIAPLIAKNNDIYTIISNIFTLNSEEEKKNYIKQFTDDILSNTYRKYGDGRSPIKLTNEQYKEIFKYSPIEEYLKIFNYGREISKELIKELQELPEDYLFNMPIPFLKLLNYDVLSFIETYGLRNVVDFDNECGHFFTKNNCEMLSLMYDMYLHYAGNEHDPKKNIYVRENFRDENGNYVDRPYNKDDFYEAMRRMIIYGPSDWNYADKAPDYRDMTGEFRVRNAELFISEQAPEKLQKLFYTKSITPQLLLEHPEYIQFLNGKDLSSCFKNREIKVEGSNALYGYENIYKFLGSKTDFNGVMNFITEYSDVLDVVFDRRMSDHYQYEIKFSINDDIDQIQNRIYEKLRKFIIEEGVTYPTHIPKDLIRKYPSMFLDKSAPKELQEAFYSRTITSEFILSNPTYRDYLNSIDLECLFKYMPINATHKKTSNDSNISGLSSYSTRYQQINFVNALKQTFGNKGALDIMLIYGKYIEQIYETNKLKNFLYNPEFTQNELLDELDKTILQNIIDENMKYDENIPEHFKKNNPTLFLGANVSQEIKDKFYNRKFTLKDFNDNPELLDIFENTNIACAFLEDMSWVIPLFNNSENIKTANYNRLKVISAYYKIQDNDLRRALKQYAIRNKDNFDIKNLEKIEYILCNIEDYETIEKYINNTENIDDLYEGLFRILDYSSCKWIIDSIKVNEKISNLNLLKNVSLYKKIDDISLQEAFKEFIMESGGNIDVEKIEYISEVLSRLSLSNSSEIYTFRKELAIQILKSNDPLESLNKIEDIFIRNNIPTVGKIYSCFEILHPDFQGFDFASSTISPVLKKSSTMSKKVIVFSDLIKSAFGSNNRTVNAYLKNIEFGSNLYESIKSGQIQFDTLGDTEIRELTTFRNHLATLYNNTMKAKKNNETFKSTGNVLTDILELSKKLSPDGTVDYNLADRVIRMFCGFTGIDTLEKAKEYIETKVKTADSRNRNSSSSDMVLEQGDFIKGIRPKLLPKESPLEACLRVLPKILQNGSNSKEFLGADSGSDATPLDTDISMIMSSDGTISEKMNETAASSYGPIWFVLKNDDRFITARTSNETLEAKRDMSKMEVFYTGVTGQGHYGIRTGFASSEINYIVMENYDPRVGLEIALNGFYIPIANKEGKIIFTPKDYDELRAKISGLSYYGMPNYNLSKNLISEEILKTKERLIKDIERTNTYSSEIKDNICDAVKYAGIMNVVDGFNSDLTKDIAEIYSTGSTSRNTNVPKDSDFDYLIKVDRTIYFNSSKLEAFKSKMKEKLGFTDGFGGKICGTIKKENGDELDVEISFCPRTDKVELSTDTSLSSKLDAIKKQYPDSYMDVLANIVYAKELLKSVKAYKSLKSDATQGGLGGIGIENWILQHGGSFYDAAKDFVEKAEKAGSFEEFKKVYQVFDLGDNHYSDKEGVYPHDNFVGGENKMGEKGYERTLQVLKEYLKSIKNTQTNSKTTKR